MPEQPDMRSPDWIPRPLLVGLSLLAASASADAAQGVERIPTLVLTGENTDRDWRYTSTHLRQILEDSGKFDVEVTLFPDGALVDAGYLERFGLVVVDYHGARWGEEPERRLEAAVEGGAGLLVVGHAGSAFPGWSAYAEMLGRPARDAGAGESDYQTFDIEIVDAEHPITSGLEPLRGHLDRIPKGFWPAPEANVAVLAAAPSDLLAGGTGEREPVLLAGEHGTGRVVHLPLGNVEPGRQESWASQRDPGFQQLLLRGAEWAATGEVTPSSRVEPNTLTAADRAAGWRLLFDGTDTSGWEALGAGLPEDRWRVDGGVLHVLPGEGGDGDIVFEERFDRFELEYEWRVAAGGDPGVVYHIREDDGAALGFDSDAAEALRILRPPGEFNHARVVATEYSVEHWLNGVHIATFDISSGEWAEMVRGRNLRRALEQRGEVARLPLARLALRPGGGDVWMRNIKIRRLPADGYQGASSPPAPLGTTGDAGVEGEATTSPGELWTWVAASQGVARDAPSPFTTAPGEITCGPGAVGYLRTNEAFAEYVIDFDYRMPGPSGEASILLHGSGPDRIWPRSIEVQLIRHYAGDLRVWGQIPARETRRQVNDVVRRSHDNENGPREWNHVELRHAGGTLTVHLNGQIVNALTELEQAPGFVGVKTAGGAVEIRNARLTPIGAR